MHKTIDNCPYDFQTLARKRMPVLMRGLRRAIRHTVPLAGLEAPGVATAALLARMRKCLPGVGDNGDFPGCYVLLSSETEAFYVGISRNVGNRIIQHVKGQTHYDASLTYRMAQADHPTDGTRAEAMADRSFLRAFKRKQAELRRGHVAAIRIENALERYVFEAYAAMKLNTCRWNTFETH